MNYKIVFLFNGRTETIFVSSAQLEEFYQRKKEEVNIISVDKYEGNPDKDIEQYLKPKTSIWNI